MWLKSQEHGRWPEPRGNDGVDAEAPLPNREGDEHQTADSALVVSPPIANAKATGMTAASEAPHFVSGQSSGGESAVNPASDRPEEEIEWQPEDSEVHGPASTAASARENLARDDLSLVDSLLDDPSLTDSADEVDNASGGGHSALRNLRMRLRFHRADLYFAVAIVVAVVALLWPGATSPQRRLSPWERVLVAVGIAETTPPPVHYHGDPQMKVWVDTHTALYYCPGDELYGKSPGGHYTTQHEAQADRFEPAQGSACIQ